MKGKSTGDEKSYDVHRACGRVVIDVQSVSQVRCVIDVQNVSQGVCMYVNDVQNVSQLSG
jgi:hypothetical protein